MSETKKPGSDNESLLESSTQALLDTILVPRTTTARYQNVEFEIGAYCVGHLLAVCSDAAIESMLELAGKESLNWSYRVSVFYALASCPAVLRERLDSKQALGLVDLLVPLVKLCGSAPSFYGCYIKPTYAVGALLTALFPMLPLAKLQDIVQDLVIMHKSMRDQLEVRRVICELVCKICIFESSLATMEIVSMAVSTIVNPYTVSLQMELLDDVVTIVKSLSAEEVFRNNMSEIISNTKQNRRVTENVYTIGKSYAARMFIAAGGILEAKLADPLLKELDIELWDGNSEGEAAQLLGELFTGLSSQDDGLKTKALNMLLMRMGDYRDMAEENDFYSTACAISKCVVSLTRDDSKTSPLLTEAQSRLLTLSHDGSVELKEKPTYATQHNDQQNEEGEEDIAGNSTAVQSATCRALRHIMHEEPMEQKGIMNVLVSKVILNNSQDTYIQLQALVTIVQCPSWQENVGADNTAALLAFAQQEELQQQWYTKELVAQVLASLCLEDSQYIPELVKHIGVLSGHTVLLHTVYGIDQIIRSGKQHLIEVLLEELLHQQEIVQADKDYQNGGKEIAILLLQLLIARTALALRDIDKAVKFEPLKSFLRLDNLW